jgi:hypothetical protein
MMVHVEEQFTKYKSLLPLIKRLDGTIHKISIIAWPVTLYMKEHFLSFVC